VSALERKVQSRDILAWCAVTAGVVSFGKYLAMGLVLAYKCAMGPQGVATLLLISVAASVTSLVLSVITLLRRR